MEIEHYAFILSVTLALAEIYDIYSSRKDRKLRQNVAKAVKKWRRCEEEYYRLRWGIQRNPKYWLEGLDVHPWIYSEGVCVETLQEDMARTQKAWGDAAEELEIARAAEAAHSGLSGTEYLRPFYN